MAKAAKQTTKKKSPPRSAGSDEKGKKLVVVESPAKAKTINKYLGKDYIVKASMGHVRDLPNRNPKGDKSPVPGVDLENNFAPTYHTLEGRRKILAELKKYAQNAPQVFLATDLDREGEAIAWHLAEALGLKKDKTCRVVFNEITRSAIAEAFAHPRGIDMNMVNAQQARRILDRIVGYQVSPLLWKKVAGGLSAGRVQSVAVRLIVEREREIEAFLPEEYWKITAVFHPDPSRAAALEKPWKEFLARRDEKGNAPTRHVRQQWLAEHGAFVAELAKVGEKRFQASDEKTALQIAQALGAVVEDIERQTVEGAKGPAAHRVFLRSRVGPTTPKFTVASLTQRESRTRPPAPFTTASLQQAASIQLYFSAQRTMRVAQQLYEGVEVPGEGLVGLITYMRTDSRNLAREAVQAVRDLIGKSYGPAYVPEAPNVYTSGERAQEAHEAIRPTDPRRRPEDLAGCLTEEQWKLYSLIWKRFVSCQMTPAVWKVTEASIVAPTPPGPAEFRAVGRTLAFDGFLRVAGIPHGEDQILPPLTEGQSLGVVEIDPTQHFTQPPPRYTEASLVKALEADNIGRPSTYATIIQTIQDRKYVEMHNRAFRPTDLGIVVTDKLVQAFPRIFEVRFTAHMEDELDQIEQARTDWVQVLHEFYGPFREQLNQAHETMTHAKAETEPSEYHCPECRAPMVYRFGKSGRFLSCSRYPDCKAALPIDRDGKPAGRQHTDIACPLCGGPTVLRKGRFGPFLSCEKYPDCKGVVNLDRKGCVKQPSVPPLAVDMKCPRCDSPLMNLRRSKRGPWLSCARYPKCRGRVAWTTLEENQRKQLEAALRSHEKAHPVATIRKLDGETVPDDYKPRLLSDESAPSEPLEE